MLVAYYATFTSTLSVDAYLVAPDPSARKQKIYRKIPKISPSMYKPLQIKASHAQTRNTKKPFLKSSLQI